MTFRTVSIVFSLIILAPQIPAAAAPCSLSPITREKPAPDISLLARVKYSFSTKTDNRGREIVQVFEDAYIHADGLNSLFNGSVRSLIPASNKHHKYTLRSISLQAAPPNAVGNFHIYYENWAYGWTKGVCSKGLKVYSCKWETKSKNFSVDAHYETTFRPSVDSATNSISVAALTRAKRVTRSGFLSGLFDFGRNVPGIRDMLADFQRKFDSLKSFRNAEMHDVPVRTVDRDLPIEFVTNKASFENVSGKLMLKVRSVSTTRPNTACSLIKRYS